MEQDEEEEEPSSAAANTRYPCMPSLVALQQMRNRLHLAFLGKKLMKWSAQATGRELRRLAADLIVLFQNFGEDIMDAYILLARARYFYPDLNKMVLQHIGHEAQVAVDIRHKSISGVKVLLFEFLDSNEQAYPLLGVEKGGQTILEAKKAWRDLLRRFVRVVEEINTFIQVDLAHKSATKRKNVLQKLIIPKLTASIKFITSELEEIEREDVFRLKRFKQLKTKRTQALYTAKQVCGPELASEKGVPKGDEIESPISKKTVPLKVETPEIRKPVETCKRTTDQAKDNNSLLGKLLSNIDDVIDLSRKYKLDGIVPAGVDMFIKTCNQVKDTITNQASASPAPVCNASNKLVEVTGSKVKLALKTVPSKSLNQPCGKTFKEIVKVTKLYNEDGSVIEEKQVITIRTETKNGTSDSNTDKNCFTDHDGNGSQESCSRPKKSKSEHANHSHQMGEPRLRACMSAQVCCPCKKGSEHSELGGGITSQAPVVCCEPEQKSASTQTARDQGGVLTIRGINNKHSGNKDHKLQGKRTVGLCDACTSTNNLETKRSIKVPDTYWVRSKSDESVRNKPKMKDSDSCYTVKIVSKPPKVCLNESPKNVNNDLIRPESVVETIKNIFLPPPSSNNCCNPKSKEHETMSICNDSIDQSSFCKMCQASIASQHQEEADSCQYSGSLPSVFSNDSTSCRSVGTGSNSSKTDCCSKKKPTTTFKPTKSSCSLCSSVNSRQYVDCATNTKRSARFDVRPAVSRRTSKKINLQQCTCQSEPNLINSIKCGHVPYRCWSFH